MQYTLRTYPGVVGLIVTNCLVFIAIQFTPVFSQWKYALGLYYIGLENFQPFQLITSFFTHFQFPHIFFNMFTLYSIGRILEMHLGTKLFLATYLLIGLLAGLFYQLFWFGCYIFQFNDFYISKNIYDKIIAWYPFFQKSLLANIGASGAIYGIFAILALIWPKAEYRILFIPKDIKAIYLLIGLLSIDFLLTIFTIPGDNFGHIIHLGGGFSGILIYFFYSKLQFFR